LPVDPVPQFFKLKKLSEDSLTKQPEEVFDVLEKLGEGSYGSVFKAIHKESGQVVAIKQVPVESDLQEIIKEISIMQQCDSPYVVKYYGSYFKNTDLWIVMEYCGAGSVSDIIRLRNKTAIFMIPTNPPPTFRKPEMWTDYRLHTLLKKCLVKNPEQRATATWSTYCLPRSLLDLITESMEMKAKRQQEQQRELEEEDDSEVEVDSHTMVKSGSEGAGTMRATSTMSDGAQTMIEHGSTMLEADLGTMVINSDEEEEDNDEGSMRRHPTSQQALRPSFMDYFDKQDSKVQQESYNHNRQQEPGYHISQAKNVFPDNWKVPQDGDFDFLKNLDFEELQLRLTALDPMMEREIEELRQRYTAKRQPILDAMDAKKRRQQNF
uniref:Non-specific serine/threonine protein kinase n=1 Tax=Oncorhynchus tshawytscha TaxID=74940 RepID=A0AAZ3QVF2_ONCTS